MIGACIDGKNQYRYIDQYHTKYLTIQIHVSVLVGALLGVEDLWARIQFEWQKIPVEVCQDLIMSMPRRIEAVIKAKGRNTKY